MLTRIETEGASAKCCRHARTNRRRVGSIATRNDGAGTGRPATVGLGILGETPSIGPLPWHAEDAAPSARPRDDAPTNQNPDRAKASPTRT
jgi:hypothetical protein